MGARGSGATAVGTLIILYIWGWRLNRADIVGFNLAILSSNTRFLFAPERACGRQLIRTKRYQ